MLGAHRHALGRQILFRLSDGIGSEMEDAGGKNGIGFALSECLVQVVQVAGPAAGDHRYRHRLGDSLG